MKTFLVIFTYVISSECGLLKDVLNSKTGQLNETEYQQSVHTKPDTTVDNGTSIVIDSFGNLKTTTDPSKSNEETTLEFTTITTSKVTEVERKDEGSQYSNTKSDPANLCNCMEKAVVVLHINIPTSGKNKANSKIDNKQPKLEENHNNSLITTDTNDKANTTFNAGVKNTTCLPCYPIKPSTVFIAGNCFPGTSRAADGTCVEIE